MQERIDALPEASELEGEELGDYLLEVYQETVDIRELTEGLSGDEQALLDVGKLEDLERFFDAGTYKEKIEVLDSLEDTVTNSMLDSMAVSMDINLPEGQVYERFMALKRTLQMMRQYEGHRE